MSSTLKNIILPVLLAATIFLSGFVGFNVGQENGETRAIHRLNLVLSIEESGMQVSVDNLKQEYSDALSTLNLKLQKDDNLIVNLSKEEELLRKETLLAQKKLADFVVAIANPNLAKLVSDKDDAVQKLDDLMEKLWRSADGSCALSSSFRAASWQMDHVGLWNSQLSVFFTVSQDVGPFSVSSLEGHSVFVWEDKDGFLWLYTNGGSVILGKNIPHDALTIAKLYYGNAVVEAYFEADAPTK